jgi:hypothetical protein
MFENTVLAVEQVLYMMSTADNIEDLDLSEYELKAFHKLSKLAFDITYEYERLEATIEEDEEEIA